MGKKFDHERLKVYQASIDFLGWLEGLYSEIERKVSAYEHLVRASASVPVNIAEASGKTSMNERRQFIDTAYGSSLECAACLDVLGILECTSPSKALMGKRQLSGIVAMLIGFRASTAKRVKEDGVSYGRDQERRQMTLFDHENLDVYQRALDFVCWCDALRRKQCTVRSVEIALDRASTGLTLNIAEGNGKFSTKDRCRFIGHARTAALQAAANLDVVAARNSELRRTADEGKGLLVDCVGMLVAWQRSLAGE
jgi:four helix bundle protein